MDSLIMDGISFLINVYDEYENKLTRQQNNKYKRSTFDYGKLILIKVF